jgi:hypothetical protein
MRTMWPKLLADAALAINALALVLNVGWLTAAMQRHHAGGSVATELFGLGVTGLLLLGGPAAALSVLTRAPPLRR